ncbi:putative mannosyltransferase [Schistosoma mansoni]|uniref:putative mannosyltransferase n=1 Tax=Schistosoma mansoni TaxID=6183 RepID=UPI0001A6309D|nr:putative mannosyltransferase [Schistosoma mansoni]|eukprot:XP_018651128.1 putative mannosyltransferase [Schistosoma mansoni]
MFLRSVAGFLHGLLYKPYGFRVLSPVLIILEILCGFIIIDKVPFTEIDWVAYMQQVSGFINGTLDYDKLVGQTGPCVYPAGHLYVYTFLHWLTGGGSLIKNAQFVFLGLYITTLLLIFNIYRLSFQIPPYALFFMCIMSYRVHSIYLLRLFNDPVAMLFLYASVNALLYNHFTVGSILFSLGVSVKMNILLFLPGFLIVLIWHKGLLETIGHLCECFVVQLAVGTPFLFHNAWAYVSSAFNFGRQFMYIWTVNWRFLPESVFLDRRFHAILLILHLCMLFVFFWKFIRSRSLIWSLLKFHMTCFVAVLYPMFVCNFVGIVISRSLHYQFYVWYFHTIPYLLWCVRRFSTPVKLLILGLIEISWNTYPSTILSSGLLNLCHLTLLVGLIMELVPIRLTSLQVKKEVVNNSASTPSKRQSRKKASKTWTSGKHKQA